MKLKNEIQQVPQWFAQFEVEKLYTHPVKEVKYLIWCLQTYAALSVIAMITASVMLFMAKGFASGFLMTVLLVFFALLQVIVLGIQAQSKFAWVLCFTIAVYGIFSLTLPLSALMFYFLNHDQVIQLLSKEANEALKTPSLVPTE